MFDLLEQLGRLCRRLEICRGGRKGLRPDFYPPDSLARPVLQLLHPFAVADYVLTKKHDNCRHIAIVEACNALTSLLFWPVLDTQSVPGTRVAVVERSVRALLQHAGTPLRRRIDGEGEN